jgi:osmotically-inducible protein OsmY
LGTTAITDTAVQNAVREELTWAPEIRGGGIGVSVQDGTVTLSGEVDDYVEKVAAVNAALRVRGVRTVVDDLVVHSSSNAISEADIAQAVDHALRASTNVPPGVQATVHGSTVTLSGEADWEYERLAARNAVRFLHGVEGVTNLVTLRERASAGDARERIREALTRNAQLDANTIDVKVDGSRAILTGTVRSFAEKRQAERAAWSSPHVTAVDNRIELQID